MKSIWDRIHAWLDTNAPAGYGNLRAGIRADEIQAAEEVMGLKLPDDVVASFRIHDGQGNGPGLIGGEGWWLLPLQNVIAQWRKWSQADPRNARLVPLAWIGMGDYVFLNLNTNDELNSADEEPCGLMIQRHDCIDPDPLVPSFSFWLEDFADELESGTFAYSEKHGEVMHADETDLS